MAERSYDTASSFVNMSDLIGHTLLVTPHEHLKDVETTIQGRKELKDPIRADIVDLTDGEEYLDALIFQGILIATLKGNLPVVDAAGEIVTEARPLLGRLSKAKGAPGENTPYKFLSPSRQYTKLADAWLDGTYDDVAPAAPVQAIPAADPFANAPAAPAAPVDPSEDPFAV